jgi:tetratricopeptide (TPR) repeat protein
LITTVVFFGLPCITHAAYAQRGQRRTDDSPAEASLRKGTDLTRNGKFLEAIPHLLAARGQVTNEYAASFNLALCYVATGQYEPAIKVLDDLRSMGQQNADVENLLAQSLIGIGRPEEAFAAVERAARMAPKNERLYLFAAEACFNSGYRDVGLKVVDLGLKHLPRSAPLFFERSMLLVQAGLLDEAKQDLQRVTELAPRSDIAYIAAAQKSLFDGNVTEALRLAREGLRKAPLSREGQKRSMLLALYGEAVLQSGIEPSDAEFAEARGALEKAIAERPNYSSAQITLGKMYLKEDRLYDAILKLNAARELDPRNPAVYSNLATAYRLQGNTQQAEAMLAILAKLNQEQVEKIRTAPGDRKADYAGRASPPPKRPPQPNP